LAIRILLGAALITIVVAVFLAAPQGAALRYGVLVTALLVCVLIALFLAPSLQPKAQMELAPPDVVTTPSSPLDSIIDELPVGLLIIGADGRISMFNAAAAEMFAVSPERAFGRSLIEVVRNSELERRVNASLRDGNSETADVAFSGAIDRRLLVSTRPLNGDRRNGVMVIVTDQTRVRELETSRREFVSNVSHELRTPLTAVKLMVETLQSGVEGPPRDQFLRSIADETERMIALVEDLLDLARLESGKLELRLSSVDVADLCCHAVQAQQTRAQASEVRLVCSSPPDPILVSADRDKLYQVLTNLMDNALRHTPPRGTVTVLTRAENGSVTIEVADTGSGIPSSALPHIFERFYVVDPARTRGHSGTGLGLAIVKHIIEAHGGAIFAESELGAGSIFRCTLPAGLQTSGARL
jgi:two-component system, OmpR family, phosphate regulon sensor histidine kinase PhoR